MITLSKLYKRDKGICHICNTRVNRLSDASRDHVIPKSLGGRGVTHNIALAHRWCNKQKGHKVFRAEQHGIGWVVVDPKGEIVSDEYESALDARIIAEELNEDRVYLDSHYEEAAQMSEDSDMYVIISRSADA
jgi:hypothetical protein